MQIPMSSPEISDQDREAVAAVLKTDRLAMGPQIKGFEEALAARVGAKHAIAVSSGTTGLHLCVRAVGIQDRDLVLTTPFSFVASTNVVLYERAIPVFVDVDPQTGNLEPELAENAIADLRRGSSDALRWLPRKGAENPGSLRAILTVDVFGQPVDYDPILTSAQSMDLAVIEDASEALGAEYKGKPAGKFGDIGVFAFYPNKQITTGEGGIVVTDRDELAAHVRALRNQGRAEGDTWLQHSLLGYNYRMTEMSAALGLSQLTRLDGMLANRAKVAAWYNERLAEVHGLEIWPVKPDTTRMSWFVYVIRLDVTLKRRDFMQRLEAMGIPSRPYFSPIHLQGYMQDRFDYRIGDFPNAEVLGQRCVALPFSSVMREEQVEYVCQAVIESL